MRGAAGVMRPPCSGRIIHPRANRLRPPREGGAVSVHRDPNEKLESVFDTADETEAMVVQGVLEAAGIESLVTSPDAPQEVMPGLGGVNIMVRADQAEEARRVIQEYRADEAISEEDIGEEPPQAESA
jgi:hypothetical protein